MARRNWQSDLQDLGTAAATVGVGRAVERSCIGRIVSMLTFIFIVLCVALYGLMWYGLTRSGLAERLPQPIGGALGMSLFVGLFVAIILAGLVGNWLRRRLWSALLRRRARR